MLDQEISATLELLNSGFPAVHTMTGPEARAAVAARRPPVTNLDDVGATEDVTVDVTDGTVGARVYHPHGSAGVRRPLVVFLHGGGFVFCDIESHDGLCRAMSRELGAVVVSVDYRRAPEHPAPTAAEDGYAVLCWAVAEQDRLGIDASRVLVAGDSAGGNLAAVTCLLARDRGGPALAGQVLLYPVLDPGCDTPSYTEYATGYFNTREAMEWYWRQYLGDSGLPEPVHLVVPGRAASLAGLPPAVVVVAGADPLRSEGEEYGDRLAAAGVPTVVRVHAGLFHGFATILTLRAGESARQLLWSDVTALLRARRPA